MSGGSYDYSYCRVNDMAYDPRVAKGSALRRAFSRHLILVSEAMRAIEWMDSGDTSDCDAEIRAVLGEHAELRELITMAEETQAALNEALNRAKA